ncbi:MAG: VanZ family protein [Gammaproteobacteria bacterium]|nr:VanZ family protein [Gammaproteobacteria bacterium]
MVSDPHPGSRLARRLLAVSVALILYGSLYPFDFSSSGTVGLGEVFALKRPSRGDLLANLLLYAPLGFCIASGYAWRSVSRPLESAAIAGLALAMLVEGLQGYLPARVSSGTDVLLNGLSAVGGAAAGLAWRLPGLRVPPRLTAPVGLVLLWLASRLSPFVPTIDWQKWKDAIKPLLLWQDFGWPSTLRYTVGWLTVALALRIAAAAPTRHLLLALLVGATIAGQVVIVGRVLRPPEFVAFAILPLGVALLQRTAQRQLARGLALLAMVTVVVLGLDPFVMTSNASPFGWLPFAGSLTDSLETNILALVEKAFLYGALLWLLAEAGLAPLAATLLVVPLLALLEFAQRWLPGRIAEVTDPLLALGLGWLLHRLQANPFSRRPAHPP